jgi:DNA-binding NtrC family response regulator
MVIGDHHILLIEDDHRLGKTFTQLFRALPVHITFVEDAENAVEQMNQEKFDLMILDLQEQEFVKLANLLQTDHTQPCTHAILISDWINEKAIQKIFKCQRIDYLLKPFDPMELIYKVENILKVHIS